MILYYYINLSRGTEEENDEHTGFTAFPQGLGYALLNGCYGNNYQQGDPCYVIATRMSSSLCLVSYNSFLNNLRVNHYFKVTINFL